MIFGRMPPVIFTCVCLWHMKEGSSHWGMWIALVFCIFGILKPNIFYKSVFGLLLLALSATLSAALSRSSDDEYYDD